MVLVSKEESISWERGRARRNYRYILEKAKKVRVGEAAGGEGGALFLGKKKERKTKKMRPTVKEKKV